MRPPNIYVDDRAWAAFKSKSNPEFGKLPFELKPEMIPYASRYNEILLRGFAVYLPGATVTAPLTIDSQLQPTGQMLHRVYDQSRVKTECQGEGGNSLCPYRNFSFVAAPSASATGRDDEEQVISYRMYYCNTGENDVCSCSGTGTLAKTVFYSENPQRVLSGESCGR